MPFLVPQTVDLARENEIAYYDGALEQGDRGAHAWRVSVLSDGKPGDLTGYTASCFGVREDGRTTTIEASIEGNVVRAIFDGTFYSVTGALIAQMVLSRGDGTTITLATMAFGVRRTRTDELVTTDERIIDLAGMMAILDETVQAAKDAQAGAAAATEAAGTATTAASNANAKATAAQTAATAAATAAGTANAAAQKLNGMTVSATALDTGEPPTAALSEVDGHYLLLLGLPRGATGATPQISVQVSTGAPGSEASVSVTGTAENPVIHMTIPKGDTGDIGSLSINGKTPDASGSVVLGISDIDGLSDAIANAGGVKTVAGVSPDSAGNVTLTAEEVGAYPASGIRTLSISIAVSAWTGSGPYTATISSTGVTDKTDCRFELGSTVSALVSDISWTTAAGAITLETASKPTGTIAGTVVLTEVSA